MEVLKGHDIIRAMEAAEDDDGTQWITIIKEGTSENNRRYRKSTLQKAVEGRVYENIRMFVDHSDGPPLKRSMRDLVSAITTTKLDESFPDGKARVRGAVEWIDEEWQKKIEKGKAHVGVSHDALLRGTRSTKNGRRFEDIDEIVRGNSVDWVIYPSAGGGFENTFVGQEGVEMKDAIDWDAIDEDMLKENKPDLYKTLIARRKEAEDDDEEEEEEEDSEEQPTASAKAEKSTATKKVKVSKLERQIESIVERAFEKVEGKRDTVASNQAKVKELVDKSTLPDLTKQRVIRSFESVQEFDEKAVKTAITQAKEEIAAIAGPKVRNAGPSGGKNGKTVTFGRAHEALESTFSRGLKKPIAVGRTVSTSTKSKKTDKDDDDEEEE